MIPLVSVRFGIFSFPENLPDRGGGSSGKFLVDFLLDLGVFHLPEPIPRLGGALFRVPPFPSLRVAGSVLRTGVRAQASGPRRPACVRPQLKRALLENQFSFADFSFSFPVSRAPLGNLEFRVHNSFIILPKHYS